MWNIIIKYKFLYRESQYTEIPTVSAHSSPTGYLHTPTSSVSSASPTPPQVLTVSENDRLQNIHPSCILFFSATVSPQFICKVSWDLTDPDLPSQFDLGCLVLTSHQNVLFLCRTKIPPIAHCLPPKQLLFYVFFSSKTIIMTPAAYATVNWYSAPLLHSNCLSISQCLLTGLTGPPRGPTCHSDSGLLATI